MTGNNLSGNSLAHSVANNSKARSLGRGGAATSNIKRYDIGRVYHKSLGGGHPRETLEASFDVVQEDVAKAHVSEAETLFVSCQVLSILPRRRNTFFSYETTTPFWYLRINHTRLADAILDLCGVPSKDSVRQAAFRILTRFTAPSPFSLSRFVSSKQSGGGRYSGPDPVEREKLESLLGEAVSKHGIPRAAADRLKAFVESCMPLSPDANECIEMLESSVSLARGLDGSGGMDPRRARRFEDAGKSLKSMKDLLSILELTRLQAAVSGGISPCESNVSLPLFVSFDLGLRQRRKHYHGGLIFQCIVLPDNGFDSLDIDEDNDTIISASGRGIKVAEGGNYSDLVRKYRPPGNFTTAFVNYYTAAPIPVCVGVRFAIGKLVELLYVDANSWDQSSDRWNERTQKSTLDRLGMDVIRHSLGHPLQYAEAVTCVIASVQGMDSASTRERFIVASTLWAQGISAEYLPQSGIMLSLLKRLREDSEDASSSDWSLAELFGVCGVLSIPFVVIVQPHSLRDRGTVRLRRVPLDFIGQGGGEIVVSLDDLAATILGDRALMEDDNEDLTEATAAPSSMLRDHRSSRDAEVECIFVDHDQYFGSDRVVMKSETPQWKAYLKWMKGISLAAESYLSSLQDSKSLGALGMQNLPVFAVADMSFLVLRDFGTALMRRERNEQSALGAANEITERLPKHKRVLKTLSIAIDNYMKRHGIWSGQSQQQGHDRHQKGSSALISLLLYSKTDDRFDLLTLSAGGRNGAGTRRK